MILILTEANDVSTNDVIDWLKYFNIRYLRVNETDEIILKNITIGSDGSVFSIRKQNGTVINLEGITHYWYRRGFFNIAPIDWNGFNKSDKLQKELINHYAREKRVIQTYLHAKLKPLNGFGSYFHNFTNKIYNLKLALDAGFDVPQSIVTSSKKELRLFSNKFGPLITKSLEQGLDFSMGQKRINQFTTEITKKDFKSIWSIGKNQIKTCKDCEFRHICSDCRAFLDSDKMYDKPLKCNYDPFTTTWN